MHSSTSGKVLLQVIYALEQARSQLWGRVDTGPSIELCPTRNGSPCAPEQLFRPTVSTLTCIHYLQLRKYLNMLELTALLVLGSLGACMF